jgi:hypothetical protein
VKELPLPYGGEQELAFDLSNRLLGADSSPEGKLSHTFPTQSCDPSSIRDPEMLLGSRATRPLPT